MINGCVTPVDKDINKISRRHIAVQVAAFAAIAVLSAILPFSLTAQITETQLLDLIARNDLETARAKVEQVARRFPTAPMTLYFKALLQTDASEAIELYRKIAKEHRESEFAPRAIYRMAQFYFARGFYHSARKNFLDAAEIVPGSSLAQKARYYAAKSLFAAGLYDEARKELRHIKDQSTSQLILSLASEDLENLSAKTKEKNAPFGPASVPVAKSAENGAYFSVQIGAFRNFDNASSQKKYFELLGYPVSVKQIVDRKITYYRVLIGKFRTRELAKDFAERFERSHKLKYQIIQLEEASP